MNTYSQVVNDLLTTYSAADVIADTQTEITNFKQTEGTSVVSFAEALCEETLRCRRVYDWSRLK